MVEPRLLTEHEAARYLGLPAATVRNLPFGHIRLGARRGYGRKALDKNLRSAAATRPAADIPNRP